MHVIRVRNVHQALPEGVYQLLAKGIPSPSRNGDVLVYPEPVTTVYARPAERVLFWQERDANPFFHLFEGLWMLAGRNDVDYVAQFVKNMRSFSDDGETLNGAYGYRWRHGFDLDQLAWALHELKKDPATRRVVIQMWDASKDAALATEGGKDVPCNTQLYVWNLAGRLQMTITCRSNDMVWGAYGANAVHFSMLQEYMAGMLGLEVGTLYQISNNFHAYANSFDPVRCLADAAGDAHKTLACPYSAGVAVPFPMVKDAGKWDLDLSLFMEDPSSNGFINPFFTHVAKPLWFAHKAYRLKDFAAAKELIKLCYASDWRIACRDWLGRRMKK